MKGGAVPQIGNIVGLLSGLAPVTEPSSGLEVSVLVVGGDSLSLEPHQDLHRKDRLYKWGFVVRGSRLAVFNVKRPGVAQTKNGPIDGPILVSSSRQVS
ncbi:MAG: hypothetical protein L0Y78_06150 [candidate division NC10 bacterium]|nr:hypothetical protein [candidate division NC10 bacterium]